MSRCKGEVFRAGGAFVSRVRPDARIVRSAVGDGIGRCRVRVGLVKIPEISVPVQSTGVAGVTVQGSGRVAVGDRRGVVGGVEQGFHGLTAVASIKNVRLVAVEATEEFLPIGRLRLGFDGRDSRAEVLRRSIVVEGKEV